MQPLLLLHGALGSKESFAALHERLNANFLVYTMNFPGHGGSPVPEDFSIPAFATCVEQFLTERKLANVNVFGYSMGGYVAIYLANQRPDLVGRIVTLGTKFHWDTQTATRETAGLNPEALEKKSPAFVAGLQRLHQPNDWKTVVNRTAAMLRQMGEEPPLTHAACAAVEAKVLLMLGDRDKMVTFAETTSVYSQLPNAQLCVLPATGHPLEKVNVDQLCFQLERFFLSDSNQ